MFYEVRLVYQWLFDPKLDNFSLVYSGLADTESSLGVDIMAGASEQGDEPQSANTDTSGEQFEHFRTFYHQFQTTVFELIVTIVPQAELGEDQETEIESCALSIIKSFSGIPIRYLYDGLYLWIWICRRKLQDLQVELGTASD
jgi:hypothetical protein